MRRIGAVSPTLDRQWRSPAAWGGGSFRWCSCSARSPLLVAPRPASAEPASQPPNAYILVDADTGKVLAGRNEHEPHLTASTVKLLTALVALERLPLDSTVPVTAARRCSPRTRST